MKKRLLSLALTLVMLLALLPAAAVPASAAEVSASSIKIGDYVRMGGYRWRCVAFEKVTGTDKNGNPIIDSTNTSQTYKDGYLPLMLADTSIGNKEFDAAGSNPSGSHGRTKTIRAENGSSYWGDSNIRDWLNSSAIAGSVVWSCGNAPSYQNEAGFLRGFSDTEKAAMKTVTQKSLLSEVDKKDIPGASGSEEHISKGNIAIIVQNYSTAYSEQVTDTMFLLDVQQVYNAYQNLGNYYYLFKRNYWLRSPYQNFSNAARAVHSDEWGGRVSGDYAKTKNNGVRPAFFLDPSAKFVCGDGTRDVPYRLSHPIVEGKDENEHYTYCANCKQEFGRAAHTYTADDSKHTCTKCGYSVTHTYDENHICTVCRHECTHSHDRQDKTTTEHYKVCPDCTRKTEPEAHTYNAENANKFDHSCSVCNHYQSHSFGAYEIVSQPSSTADGVKKRTCSICGYVEETAFKKSQHAQNSAHNLCNDSECTIADHKLPTTGRYRSWDGTKSTSELNYSFGTSPDISYTLYNVIDSGTTLTRVWELPDYIWEKKLYNCLNGVRLTLSGGAYIHIESGKTYSLTDCREGVGDVVGGTNGVIKIDKGGTFNFYEGTITGNSGDGIIVNNGTMNLYGGTIMNNTGAAIINNGTLNIYGGTITNNTGGGILGTGTINFKTVDCSTGNPVIANNTVGGKPCNIKGASKISVTALGEEASIGFTPAEAVTAGTPVAISATGGEYYSRFVCDNGDHAIIQKDGGIQLVVAHSVLEAHPAVSATCTQSGNEAYWSCVDCNRLYRDKDGKSEIFSIPTTEATGHSITHHQEVPPTCTEGGTEEYWSCTVCKKLFSDEDGQSGLDAVPTTEATGHAWRADWTGDATGHWHACAGCDAIQDKATHVYDDDQDGECNVCGYTRSVAPAYTLRYEPGKAVVTAAEAGQRTVIFAAYDEAGKLTSLSVRNVTVKAGDNTVEAQNFTPDRRVKVMLLDSLGGLIPLCPAATNE